MGEIASVKTRRGKTIADIRRQALHIDTSEYDRSNPRGKEHQERFGSRAVGIATRYLENIAKRNGIQWRNQRYASSNRGEQLYFMGNNYQGASQDLTITRSQYNRRYKSSDYM